MRLRVYSVYDKKTMMYYAPVCYHNDEHMMRDFGLSLSRQSDGPIVKFPQDYEVFEVGTWTDESGLLAATIPVRWVCGVAALLSPAVEQADVIPFGKDIVPPSQESGGGQGPRKK